MPPPKDPEKYKEYVKRQSESHMGKPSCRLGKKHTEKAIQKMREIKKGKYDGEKNPFFGKKHTQKTLETLRSLAKNRSETTLNKIRVSLKGRIPWNKGIPVPEATRIKSSESQKGEKGNRYGKHHTKEAKEKIRKAQTGKIYSEKTLKKMSENRIGKCRREKNPNWKNGISFGKYCYKNNERRHKAVRIFFDYFCICCGKHVTENIIHWKNMFKQIEHSVHHVDHNKDQGCDGIPFNLVPLCHECHSKELHHQQEYKDYINKTLKSGFEWGIWSKEQYEIEVMYPE